MHRNNWQLIPLRRRRVRAASVKFRPPPNEAVDPPL
jgi:hypothetical protein